jgi:hypothetical protein
MGNLDVCRFPQMNVGFEICSDPLFAFPDHAKRASNVIDGGTSSSGTGLSQEDCVARKLASVI